MVVEKAAGRPRPSIISLVIAVLLIPAVLGSSQMIFNDGDVSWHIATGLWILDHRAIPQVDPFSFTCGGKPWVPIEWLAELIYASAYRVARYPGVAALVTAALVGLHAAVFLNANRWVRMTLLPIVAMDLVLIPMLLARPHVLTWPILAWWCWLMMRAREQDRAPPLPAALLMTLWANLHGGYVFGLAIAAAFGIEALVASEDKARALRQWLTFGLACAAAVFVNGNGVEGVFHPLRFTQLEMLPLIDEWKPSSPGKTPYAFGVLAVVVALIAWKRPRLHWIRWLLLAALLGLALLQVRHQSTLAIVAAMLLPAGFVHSRREATDPAWKWVILGGAGNPARHSCQHADRATRQRRQSVESDRRGSAGAPNATRAQRLFDGRSADPVGNPALCRRSWRYVRRSACGRLLKDFEGRRQGFWGRCRALEHRLGDRP